VTSWSFLTNHAGVLLCIAHDPGVRLCDIAASVDIAERSAYGIVTDLTEASCVVKQKDGRRNRTRSRHTCRCPNLPARNPLSAKSSPSLAGADARLQLTRTGPA
jgi:hypothetical protein